MLDKLAGIASRYDELEQLMADPTVAADYEKVAEYAQERSSLQPLVDGYRHYRATLEQIEEVLGDLQERVRPD